MPKLKRVKTSLASKKRRRRTAMNGKGVIGDAYNWLKNKAQSALSTARKYKPVSFVRSIPIASQLIDSNPLVKGIADYAVQEGLGKKRRKKK